MRFATEITVAPPLFAITRPGVIWTLRNREILALLLGTQQLDVAGEIVEEMLLELTRGIVVPDHENADDIGPHHHRYRVIHEVTRELAWISRLREHSEHTADDNRHEANNPRKPCASMKVKVTSMSC